MGRKIKRRKRRKAERIPNLRGKSSLEKVISNQGYRDLITVYLNFEDCCRSRRVSRVFRHYLKQFAQQKLAHDQVGFQVFGRQACQFDVNKLVNSRGVYKKPPMPTLRQVVKSISKLDELELWGLEISLLIPENRQSDLVHQRLMQRMPTTITKLEIGHISRNLNTLCSQISRFQNLRHLHVALLEERNIVPDALYSALSTLNLTELVLDHVNQTVDFSRIPMKSLKRLYVWRKNGTVHIDLRSFPNLEGLTLINSEKIPHSTSIGIAVEDEAFTSEGFAPITFYEGPEALLLASPKLRQSVEIWDYSEKTYFDGPTSDLNEMKNLKELKLDISWYSHRLHHHRVPMRYTDSWDIYKQRLMTFMKNGGLLTSKPRFRESDLRSRWTKKRWEVQNVTCSECLDSHMFQKWHSFLRLMEKKEVIFYNDEADLKYIADVDLYKRYIPPRKCKRVKSYRGM